MQKLSIPESYKDQLRYVDARDSRSDNEILESVASYSPVTSEKNLWAFWHSGVSQMPAWCQRNVINWVRLCGSSWTVRVLNSVPDSPNYTLKYVDREMLPDAYVNGSMEGLHVGQHSADLVRGACLYLYGGVWMDVGIIMVRDLDRACWDVLQDPDSPFQVACAWLYGLFSCNYFVACRKNDPFVKRWHELFTYLWKDRNSSSGLISHPLLGFAHQYNPVSYGSDPTKFNLDFNVDPRIIFEYIIQIVAWSRLCMLEDAGDGFSCTDYWQNHILCINAYEEHFGAEAKFGHDGKGREILDLLSVRLDENPDSDQYKTAQTLVFDILSKTSFQKIYHGKGLTKSTPLGELLELPENEGIDAMPGTFAEALRYGSVHFEQTRTDVHTVQAPKPPATMNKGLLEP